MQILIIALTVIYIYLTFRHPKNIIPTAATCIEQISPGLTELTKVHDELVFWFYSLSEGRYKKYTLDDKMKITEDTKAQANAIVNKLSNNFYYNFGLQRWEKREFIKDSIDVPTIDNITRSIEQKYMLCFLDETTNSLVCDENRMQSFIKLRIGDEQYTINEKTQKLELIMQSVFPSANTAQCKFTSNRYREYLGLYYDYRNENDNIEQNIGIYFVYSDTMKRWHPKECESVAEMFFDGTTCRRKYGGTLLRGSLYAAHRHINEIFTKQLVSSDLQHDDILDIKSFVLNLTPTISMCLNMNVHTKRYMLDNNFYNACYYTLFVVGAGTGDDGDTYEWSIEQNFDESSKNKLLNVYQQLCPRLMEPLQAIYVRDMSTFTVDRPFVIYKNYIYYMQEYLMKFYRKMIGSSYDIIKVDEMFTTHTVRDITLLPHLRQYTIVNDRKQKCIAYAMFAGETVFDIYVERRLIIDYVKNLFRYDFYMRDKIFPILEDDFQLDTWSCVYSVNEPNMYVYLSLVDIYNMYEFATGNKTIDY